MGMELKTKTRFSSYNLMHNLSKGFRGLGWFTLFILLGYSIPRFFSSYNMYAAWTYTASDALPRAANDMFSFVVGAFTLAACAFLISVMLYTGLVLLTQRRAQITLLERLARERHEKLSDASTLVLIDHL